MDLRISRVLAEAIGEEAGAAGGHECCGLLLGEAGSGAIRAIRPAANVAAAPAQRFEIDPAVLLAAHKAAREGGLAVIGHYHSHPGGAALPSACDAAMAERRGEIWLIVDGAGEMAAWRAQPTGALHGCFDPLGLTIVEPGDEPAVTPVT